MAKTKKSLTPEQQESLNIFVSNGIKIIHTPATTDELLQQMQVTPNKAEAIGSILASIIKRLEISAEENQVELSVEVILVGTTELLQELILIAEGTGKIEKVTTEQIKEAVGYAVGIYLQDQIASGRITKEELAATAQSLQSDPELKKTLQDGEKILADNPDTQQPMPSGGQQAQPEQGGM